MISEDVSASHKTLKPTHVAINAIHAKSGGGITYLRNVLPLLAEKQNIKLHLFLHKDQFELFYPIHENINVICFSFKPSFWGTLIWEQVAIPLKTWAMGCDVVFSPANYGPILGKNNVILLRNAVTVIKLSFKFKSVIYWLTLTGATIISLLAAKKAIAVSEYANRLLTFGLTKQIRNKCSVVYHGVDQKYAMLPKKVRSSKQILAVSDIYIQKNYHTLLRAFSLLLKKYPEIVLNIVGQEIDRSYGEDLKKLAKDLNIENNIFFRGHVQTDELAQYYRTCAVFVFPSLIETFGNPLLEAMVFGSPIACSREAAMPEILLDTGLYFDPKDEEDMATTIDKLLSDQNLSDKLGLRASQRARSFMWSETARKTHEVFEEVATKDSNSTKMLR